MLVPLALAAIALAVVIAAAAGGVALVRRAEPLGPPLRFGRDGAPIGRVLDVTRTADGSLEATCEITDTRAVRVIRAGTVRGLSLGGHLDYVPATELLPEPTDPDWRERLADEVSAHLARIPKDLGFTPQSEGGPSATRNAVIALVLSAVILGVPLTMVALR